MQASSSPQTCSPVYCCHLHPQLRPRSTITAIRNGRRHHVPPSSRCCRAVVRDCAASRGRGSHQRSSPTACRLCYRRDVVLPQRRGVQLGLASAQRHPWFMVSLRRSAHTAYRTLPTATVDNARLTPSPASTSTPCRQFSGPIAATASLPSHLPLESHRSGVTRVCAALQTSSSLSPRSRWLTLHVSACTPMLPRSHSHALLPCGLGPPH